METQAKVLAMLNKIKQVREARKENLGAIEDAIKEVQGTLVDISQQTALVIDTYDRDVSDIINQVAILASDLITIIQDASSKYSDYENKYLQTANELDSLGINYDNSLPDLSSNFKDVNTSAVDFYNTLTRI